MTKTQRSEILDARIEAQGSKWDDKIHSGSGMCYYDLRYKVGVAINEDGHSITDVCCKFGVSRSFAFKWGKIYLARKEENKRKTSKHNLVTKDVFRSISNRPKTVICPVQDDIRDVVVKRRRKYPFEGSFRIKAATGIDASPTTINKVLRSENLMDIPKPRHVGKTYGRFQRPWTLELVQTDYKTWSFDVKSIWMLDDCSRMILAHRIVPNSSADIVIELLQEVIDKYGAPDQILSDHGAEFYSVTGGKGASKLDKFCKKMGIEHIMGRVRHPETQGKMERTHRSASEEIHVFGSMETLEEARKTFDNWVNYYNWDRPHQSLGYSTPGAVFTSMHNLNLEELSAF